METWRSSTPYPPAQHIESAPVFGGECRQATSSDIMREAPRTERDVVPGTEGELK